MRFSRKEIFTLVLSLTLGFVAVMPHTAHGLGDAADKMCNPVDMTCPCKMVKNPNPKGPRCIPGPNMFMCPCWDITSDFRTNGQCVAQMTCQAQSTSGKDGFGLDQVAKILGDLFGKLMQSGKQSGQQQSPTPSVPAQPPTCSISSGTVSSDDSSTIARLSWSAFFYDSAGGASTPGTATISPDLGTVEQNGSREVTVTTATTYTMTVSGAGGTGTCSTTVIGLGGDGGDGGDVCTGPFAALYDCEDDTGDDGDEEDDIDTGTTFSASPTSGVAPLTVNFTHRYRPNRLTQDCDPAGVVQHGDSSSFDLQEESIDTCHWPSTHSHTYQSPGTYTARISDIGSVAITVRSATTTATTTTTTTTTTQVFTNAAFLLPGLRGDIQALPQGGFVVAGARDQSRNTEISGFYGSYTFNEQPQGVISQLCQNRPWATNFLSYIVPATFFDGLCAARGYRVGQAPSTTVAPTITVTQTRPAQAATTTVNTGTNPASAVQPRVRVWAVPASVPLGSRTSVFWTTQGVSSCTVSSPDGSFSQTSLSGGASTVPLTAATTYTISCLAPDGTPVTAYTIVNISI